MIKENYFVVMYYHRESRTEIQLTRGDYESQELCLLISRPKTIAVDMYTNAVNPELSLM